ncbi:MAG: hypothetical protein LLG01_17230 [Planctomycetaceae bacterium]|nr:hypothetical protein [Planctomycetaceae bacterium]
MSDETTTVDTGTAPAAETPAAADQTAAPESTTTETTAPAGAPEAYQWTMPEGVTLDPTVLDAYGTAARELGLPQDQAQSIVDRVAPAMAAAQAAQVKAWEEAAAADPEIGGDKLPETLATAKAALEALGTPEMVKTLNELGWGSHPDVIRFMAKVGRAIGPDTIPARGNGPSNDGRSIAQRLFSSMPNP